MQCSSAQRQSDLLRVSERDAVVLLILMFAAVGGGSLRFNGAAKAS
jgi:hypothetical protein